MTTIATTYLQSAADGSTPSPTSINRDIFRPTAGFGLMSTGNGDYDADNVRDGFTIVPEHIQPGQTTRYAANASTEKLDYVSDLVGVTDDDPDTADHVRVWGFAARVSLPFVASAVFWEISFFRSIWLYHAYVDEAIVVPSVSTRLILSGDSVVPHSLRRHPATAHARTWPPPASVGITAINEGITADWYHIGHLETGVAADHREIRLELYMQSTEGIISGSAPLNKTSLIAADGTVANNGGNGYDCDVHTRITFGIGSATAYALL